MENKYIIIIVAVVIALIAIGGVIFATGALNNNEVKNVTTTPFNTTFMEGAFMGNVTLVNDTETYMHSYEDKENNITYNVSTVDDTDSLMDIYGLQGVTNPEERNFNGNDWNIYFTQAVPTDENITNATPMTIVICQSQGSTQGYLIYIIFGSNTPVNATTNVFGESYTDFVEPLLKNVTLKQSSDVPKIYDQFGLTEEQFQQQMDLIHQYYAGNTSALDGGVQ